MKNILLLKGGGGSEHDVSLISAQYVSEQTAKAGFNVIEILIDKDQSWKDSNSNIVSLNHNHELVDTNGNIINKVDYCIPCFHGFPGESGEIPSLLELYNIPYLGCTPEGSIHCFNKISTKLWMNSVGIPNAPFIMTKDYNDEAVEFFNKHQDIYVKASNQGSSVGCFHITSEPDLKSAIEKAIKLSPYVLLEKTITGRELEVSVFEYQGKIHATAPGEILCPEGEFYDYDQKYSQDSNTVTHVEAKNISSEQAKKIKDYATQLFKLLNLKDLARVDFFLTESGEIFLNEPNTFPGMTSISLFPKMMENSGVLFSDFLNDRISQ